MQQLSYGLSVKLNMPFEAAVTATKDALKTEQFGVLTEIDVRKTLQEKIGADFRHYVILGACNPSLAYAGLQHDLDLGLLLPCNVVVREDNGGSVVMVMDPLVMSQISPAPGLREVAQIAREKLERALALLAKS